MSTSAWGIAVSAFFALLGIFAPIPDGWKIGLFIFSGIGFLGSCFGWVFAYRRESRVAAPDQYSTLTAIVEQARHPPMPQPKPELHASVLSVGIRGLADGAGITVFLEIRNSGTPSIADDFTATIRSGDSTYDLFPAQLPPNSTYANETGEILPIHPSDTLYAKLKTPIEAGGRVFGFVFYFAEGLSAHELTKNKPPEIVIHFRDVKRKAYVATSEGQKPLYPPGFLDPFISLASGQATVHRQALLTKIRDLVVSTESKISDRFDEMGALIKFSDEFENEAQVTWVCDELQQRGFQNPFKVLESAAPSVFEGRCLEFLRDARTCKIEIRRITSAISFAVKNWRHSEEYIKARRAVIGWSESEDDPQEVKPGPPTVDKTRVGFLQLDKLTYHRKKALIAGKHFTITPSFKNRGQFPVYNAQVYALLVYWPAVSPTADADACRELRRLVQEQWKKTSGSQVAVDGSIYFPTSVESMSQEQIDAVVAGKCRIYRITRARWENDLGQNITPEWDECSCLERPASANVDSLALAWRICNCL